jgi:hypothetical protein
LHHGPPFALVRQSSPLPKWWTILSASKHQRRTKDHRFPPPWTVEQIPGGYKVKDANGQSLAYVYGRETRTDADIAHVLTMDEARRIASNIAKLPTFLAEQSHEE